MPGEVDVQVLAPVQLLVVGRKALVEIEARDSALAQGRHEVRPQPREARDVRRLDLGELHGALDELTIGSIRKLDGGR